MKCPLCGRDNLTDRELEVHIKIKIPAHMNNIQPQGMVIGMCPECGATLFHQEGCISCQSCGYSKC